MVALPSLAACLPMQIHTTSYPPTIRTQQLCHRDRCYAWGVALAHV